MKKSLKRGIAALLTVLLLALVCGTALADSVISSAGKSYIRSQPNLYGTAIGALPEGEIANYLGETATDDRGIDWYYISYQGVVGWISSRYVDLLSSGYGTPQYPDPYEPAYYDHYVVAVNGRTYIRSAPSTDADDLGTLPEGASAPYLEEYSVDRNGRYWYKIKYSGVTGWVSARYTELQ